MKLYGIRLTTPPSAGGTGMFTGAWHGYRERRSWVTWGSLDQATIYTDPARARSVRNTWNKKFPRQTYSQGAQCEVFELDVTEVGTVA